jgi:hypothetical protein
MSRILRAAPPGRRRLLLAFGIVIALTKLSAAADQTDELAHLRAEAVQLRQALEGLEARIQVLERQNRDPAARRDTGQPQASRSEALPAAQIFPLVSLKQNWAQVQPGIPEDKVQALLGRPEKVLHIDGTLVWYYLYPGIGRASVSFNGNGRVSGTQPPSLGW